MIIIKWNEAALFTYNEMSYFTWEDIMAEKIELVGKARQDIKVPDEIISKLEQLCNDALKLTGDYSLHLPKYKKFRTVSEAVKGTVNEAWLKIKTIYSILQIWKDLPECLEYLKSFMFLLEQKADEVINLIKLHT